MSKVDEELFSTTLVTADIHASANPRDAYRWGFIEGTLPAMVREHEACRVLLLGDFTEQKDGHPAALVNRLVDAVARLAEVASVYLLRGNHDCVAEDAPFFRFTRHLPHVRWINEPTVVKLRGLGDCLFLPHSRSTTAEWRRCLTRTYDWYFCHQTFDGARGENGQSLSGISRDIFPKGARVVSGDVHVPQRVGSVTYAGAPTTIDFGDVFEPRVLLLEGHKMRSVPVPGPQKRLMTISGMNPLAALSMKKHPFDVLTPIKPGDVIKVRVELPAAFKTPRAEVRAQVRDWANEAGVHLYATEIITPKAAPTKPARDRHRASDMDLVRAYAKKMRQGKASVAAGLKIAEEVS